MKQILSVCDAQSTWRKMPGGRAVFACLAVACGLAASVAPAAAGDTSVARTPAGETPGWIITLGGSLAYSPDFAGAKNYSLYPLPSISWRREGQPAEFSAPDDGLDYAIIDTPTFKVGPVGALSSGRSKHDEPRLEGLHNYSIGIEAGVFVDYWAIADVLRTRLELRHGFRSADGFNLDLGADYVRHSGLFIFSVGPRLSFADTDQMKQLYGVSDQEAANSIFPAFKPTAGLESVGGIASLSYAWTPDITLTVYDRFDRLVGDAADSPITQQIGSPNQNTVGVGMTYSFHTGR